MEEVEQHNGMTAQVERNRMKPGKAVKVTIAHFNLRTVLGRGGYGKVMIN